MHCGDYVGKCSIDFPGGCPNELKRFVKDQKIDTSGVSIIGIEFMSWENDFREKPVKICLSLLVVEDKEWKDKYENIHQYGINEKTLKVKKISTEVDFYDFFTNYVRSFAGKLVWSHLDDKELDITKKEE